MGIEVRQTATGEPLEFRVVVTDGRGQSRHRVRLRRAAHERLTGGAACAEECVRAAFEFLLEHEPKEAIPARFDVDEIARDFPDFESALQQRFAPCAQR